jgi:hypothetical protein
MSERRHEQEKGRLVLLRSLAAEGFDELDQGQGIRLDEESQLRALIARIGRCAAGKIERQARRSSSPKG